MDIISQKSDDVWRFRCYAPSGVGSGFHTWYDALTPEIVAEFDRCISLLRPVRNWSEPEFKPLVGACAGLEEIRFEVAGRDYRVLGFTGPRWLEFTLLLGFEKITTSSYGPACRSAHTRKAGVIRDVRRAPYCDF